MPSVELKRTWRKEINVLYGTHSGINRMEGLARSYVRWPKMDAALEERVKSCEVCQAHQKTPAPAPLHPWEWQSCPWSRVHIDYVGPLMRKTFLLIISAHSKWLDVHCVNSASTVYNRLCYTTIEKLRATVATHGLSEMIVSDNGSVFVFASGEFKVFMHRNSHSTIPSLFECPGKRAVRTFKLGTNN